MASAKRWFTRIPGAPSANSSVGKIRKLMYDTVIWNEEKFSKAYDNHEKKVLEHFKNRKNDLLVINVCKGEGWEKVCPFLESEIPTSLFPNKYKWKNRK